MSKQTVESYSFVASTKVITFSDHPTGTVDLDRVLLIENVTRGVFYYVPGSTSYNATVSTNTLTLNSGVSTSGHSDSDKLRILYDYPTAITKHVSTSETLTANTVPNSSNGRTLTPSGFAAQEVEISNLDGAAIVYGTMDGSTPSSTNFLFALPATPCNVVLPVTGAVTVKVISAGTPKVGYTIRGG